MNQFVGAERNGTLAGHGLASIEQDDIRGVLQGFFLKSRGQLPGGL